METLEYPLSKGARSALNIVGVLCVILIIAVPVAIWIFVRVAGAKVVLSAQGVLAKGLGSTRFAYNEVARLGVCRVPITAKGMGGVLARKKVGGNEAIRVVIKNAQGKQKSFIVSSYDHGDEIMANISERVGKPFENLETGAFGVKWPATGARIKPPAPP